MSTLSIVIMVALASIIFAPKRLAAYIENKIDKAIEASVLFLLKVMTVAVNTALLVLGLWILYKVASIGILILTTII